MVQNFSPRRQEMMHERTKALARSTEEWCRAAVTQCAEKKRRNISRSPINRLTHGNYDYGNDYSGALGRDVILLTWSVT